MEEMGAKTPQSIPFVCFVYLFAGALRLKNENIN
jgi:hypothetical protein